MLPNTSVTIKILARADFLTPIHKALRSMIYELGKELQTTDFTDEHEKALGEDRWAAVKARAGL